MSFDRSAESTAAMQPTAMRYAQLRSELDALCARAGRNPADVRLIAVSKTVGIAQVDQARAAGARDFAENRPDGLMEKHDAFPGDNWHFIGNIQSRRIRDIVGRATLIHSLCEVSHARKIDAEAAALGIVQDVLLEVNVSGEESKSGLAPADVIAMLDECAALSHMRVRGLMTMAPRGDASRAREVFDELRRLRDELRIHLPADKAEVFDELSMGMSEDWQEAVFAGATMIRVGRAIFSDRFEEVRSDGVPV